MKSYKVEVYYVNSPLNEQKLVALVVDKYCLIYENFFYPIICSDEVLKKLQDLKFKNFEVFSSLPPSEFATKLSKNLNQYLSSFSEEDFIKTI